MIGTTQAVLDWSRFYIPDPKTRTKAVRNFEIGRTAVPTSERETFYIKQVAVGTVQLYVDPYLYASTASLSIAAATDRVFMFNATLQSCVFPKGSDPSIRPAQYRSVFANYNYTEEMPYGYSDTELVEFLPAAINYLNNTYGYGYSHSGTISTFETSLSTDSDRELMAKSLAIIVRNSFVAEQMRQGLGVAFRGPLMALDSKQQMKEYNAATKALEKSIETHSYDLRVGSTGGGVDLYTENVVTE